MYVVGGRALDRLGGFIILPNLTKLRIPTINYTADTLRVLSPWWKGKQPRSLSKVPKLQLSGEGSGKTITARRLAWKQPSFKESVIAHLSK